MFLPSFEDFAVTGGIVTELDAAGALIGLSAGAVVAGEEGAVAGAVLGADAAMGAGEFGLSQEDIDALGDELEVGGPLLGYSRPAEE